MKTSFDENELRCVLMQVLGAKEYTRLVNIRDSLPLLVEKAALWAFHHKLQDSDAGVEDLQAAVRMLYKHGGIPLA